MVIVTTHAITAFLVNEVFKTSKPETCETASASSPASCRHDQSKQLDGSGQDDFTVQLLECEDLSSLGTVVKTCLHTVTPQVAGGALFFIETQTGNVFTADFAGHHICMPFPDCIRRVLNCGQPLYLDASYLPKCVLQQLPSANTKIYTQKVGCFPIHSRDDGGKVTAVLVVVGNGINQSVAGCLSTPIKQIAACYNHIQRTFQSPRNTEERVNHQLIKLCGELYDQDASQLQLKVLKYLEEQTQAERAFLLLVVPDTQELFCQVVGKRILEDEVRFPGQSSSFSVALETKQPITLPDIPKENVKGLEELVECPIRSLICVPVMNRSENNLIALVCLVNKLHANSFSDLDISSIRQCFRYTATVLTSTLAFQNERKLKVQTQALLQVARHLFTNLGELSKEASEYGDFPYVVRSKCGNVSVFENSLENSLLCPHWRLDRICDQCKKLYVSGGDGARIDCTVYCKSNPEGRVMNCNCENASCTYCKEMKVASQTGEIYDTFSGPIPVLAKKRPVRRFSVAASPSPEPKAAAGLWSAGIKSTLTVKRSPTRQLSFSEIVESLTADATVLSDDVVATPFQITFEKGDSLDHWQVCSEVGVVSVDDLTKLLREIMQQARNLTHAERCSVFLIDTETDELVAKVFDGISTNKVNEVQEEIRLPSTQGIAGQVATSGELLNIKDAYSHPLFYRGIDVTTGFRTRNILCFPIKDEKGVVLGVAQLCNKMNGPCFTQFDEDLASAFGIYCCISISHSLMYKKVIDSQVRNSLANELMMYHMKSLMYKKLLESQHRKSLANELMIYHMQEGSVKHDDVSGLATCEIPNPRLLHPDFALFSYAPRALENEKTLVACLSMFDDLNLISKWRIRRETLARFVLMVKKGYRNPPYHNWTHAYTVAQFCYQLVKNLKLENYLDDIDIFALFIACLCHDIDHRGTNNSFQTASKSVLAALYSSEGSVLERHHFAQTMCILNTEGCNVFQNLNSKDYQTVLDSMRDIILATDLAHHFKILKGLEEMAKRGYNRNNPKDRKMLLCLLMTSCDLSDQTKPWENTKRVAALIYKEFFSQGDMEKAKGIQPSDMMDREKAHIPAVQIGFLDHVALPVYRILSDLFVEAGATKDRVENNKAHWERIAELVNTKKGGSTAKMTFDEVLAMEAEDQEEQELQRAQEAQGSVPSITLNHHSLTNGQQEDVDV